MASAALDLRDADEPARIDAISQNAAQQRQGELGHETAKKDEAQLRLRSRDLEGEPAQRKGKHVLADDLRDQGQPVEAKVARLQREKGVGFVFHEGCGSCCHSKLTARRPARTN